MPLSFVEGVHGRGTSASASSESGVAAALLDEADSALASGVVGESASAAAADESNSTAAGPAQSQKKDDEWGFLDDLLPSTKQKPAAKQA